MATPKQVAEAEAKANELIEKQGKTSPAEPPPVQTQEPQPPTDVKVTDIPAPRIEEPKPPVQGGDTWEARYHTLLGKYEAEVPYLTRQLEEVNKRMIDQMHMISDLNQRLSQGVPQQASQPQTPPQVPEGVQFVQSEFPEVAQYVEHRFGEVEKKIDQLINSRVGDLSKQVEGVQASTQESMWNRFLSDMGTNVPDWETVNNQPGFKQWLETPDGLGRTLMPTLQNAWARMDVGTATKIFNAFKSATAQPSSRDKGAFTPPPTSQQGSIADSQVDEVQPVEAKFIDKFYDDWRRGAYKSRPEEAQRIENMINRAVAAGRVTR